ncbi:hypothetical protein J450_02040 [Mannheimia haemolytica D171]|nr:hypothetical protein J450_02040 [Mannheimia haemolytica D171]
MVGISLILTINLDRFYKLFYAYIWIFNILNLMHCNKKELI